MCYNCTGMPRNADKKHCQIPGCTSWAMRGQNLCRSHRDQELGPRAAGAPKGNFNAVKVGDYANPLSKSELHQLAYHIAQQPDHLPVHLDQTLQTIYARDHSPLKTLLLFARLLDQLTPMVAGNIFSVELDAYLQDVSPTSRSAYQAHLWKHFLPMNPLHRLILLRNIVKKLPAKLVGGKTINGK